MRIFPVDDIMQHNWKDKQNEFDVNLLKLYIFIHYPSIFDNSKWTFDVIENFNRIIEY